MSAEEANALLQYAPASAQLVRLHGAGSADALSTDIEKALFGKLLEQSWTPPEIPDRTRKNSSDDENTRAERYSRLDARFDIDVDDEQAPKRRSGDGGKGSGAGDRDKPAGGGFAKSIAAILTSGSSGAYCELVRSKAEAGKPFVRFERAVVVPLGAQASRLPIDQLENAIINEIRARFVVAGIEPQLAWQEEGTVRFVAQSLLNQGAAYSVSGNYLVLASTREFAGDILQAKASIASAEKTDTPLDFYSLIRVASAKPVFDTLMSKLDGREPTGKATRGKDDEEREVKFFSENLSSLIAASAIREVRLGRQSSGAIMTERVVYSW